MKGESTVDGTSKVYLEGLSAHILQDSAVAALVARVAVVALVAV